MIFNFEYFTVIGEKYVG